LEPPVVRFLWFIGFLYMKEITILIRGLKIVKKFVNLPILKGI